ncbi:hypothetical protein BH09GEM1_BH09GEM1_28530 [soil metagenome]
MGSVRPGPAVVPRAQGFSRPRASVTRLWILAIPSQIQTILIQVPLVPAGSDSILSHVADVALHFASIQADVLAGGADSGGVMRGACNAELFSVAAHFATIDYDFTLVAGDLASVATQIALVAAHFMTIAAQLAGTRAVLSGLRGKCAGCYQRDGGSDNERLESKHVRLQSEFILHLRSQ